MNANPEIHSFSDGEVTFWIEQGETIHLKAVSPHGDPTELTEAEAKKLALALLDAVNQIETLDSK
jgi:hypothetical protein